MNRPFLPIVTAELVLIMTRCSMLVVSLLCSADVVLKLVNATVSKLLSDHPALIAAVVVGTGAYLT